MSLHSQLCSEDYLKLAWSDLQKRASSQGLDEVTIDEFRNDLGSHIKEISIKLKNKAYEPAQLKPHLLKKPEGGFRLLKIPAVRDRVVQRAILNLIGDKLDKKYTINDNGVSFAYIKGGGVNKAAEAIIRLRAENRRYAYKADIESFFDNIDKKILIKKIEAALSPDTSLMPIIKKFLDNDIANLSFVERRTGKIYNNNPLLGVAQGSPLSPVFANVYLGVFDMGVVQRGFRMVRYADDLVIMCQTRDEARDAHLFVKDELLKLKLNVYALKDDIPKRLWAKNPKCSEIKTYQNLEFLGLVFRSDKVYPSGKSYRNALRSIRAVSNDRGRSFIEKIVAINARVGGWCSAFKFTNREGAKIEQLDKGLEEILAIVLRKHGLGLKKGQTAVSALGIKSYSSLLS